MVGDMNGVIIYLAVAVAVLIFVWKLSAERALKSRLPSKYRMSRKDKKELKEAHEGVDEEFDGYRMVLIRLTAGGMGVLFAFLAISKAIEKIQMFKAQFYGAVISFAIALGLLLLSYLFGWFYFDCYSRAIRRGRRVQKYRNVYSFLNSLSVAFASISFLAGFAFAVTFVFRFVG